MDRLQERLREAEDEARQQVEGMMGDRETAVDHLKEEQAR